MKPPIVRIDRWHYRTGPNQVASCRLETWVDAQGLFNILVTERGDNPGPNITNSHEALRRAVEIWLDLPRDLPYVWYEQYDANSYVPPDPDRVEICFLDLRETNPRWRYVPDWVWDKIYTEARKPKPVVKRRSKKTP